MVYQGEFEGCGLIAQGRLGPFLAGSKTGSIFAHFLQPIFGVKMIPEIALKSVKKLRKTPGAFLAFFLRS